MDPGGGAVGPIFSAGLWSVNAGLLASSGTITSTGTTINVTSRYGDGAYAAGALGPATINLINNTITTTGIYSAGIYAASNSQIVGNGGSVTTSGGGAALVMSMYNGPVSINIANMTAKGTGDRKSVV